MNVYLSCGTSVEREAQFIKYGFNRLFSNYSDRKNIHRYIEMGGTGILLDSGAFSAYNSGKSIDIDDYARFANSITEHCTWIVNLDVIGGDPSESYGNWVYLRERLHEPNKLMPVFHLGESIEWLQKYIDDGSPSIGVGGIARVSPSDRKRMMELCDSILCNAHIYVHVFGVTTIPLIEKYSWVDSIDSVTWRLNAGYANVMMPSTMTCVHLGHGLTKASMARGYIDKSLFSSMYVDKEFTYCLHETNLTVDDLFNSDKARELFNAYVFNYWGSRHIAKPRAKPILPKKLF